MRTLLVIAGFSLSTVAVANPCSSGSNVSLTDTTTASQVEAAAQQQPNGTSATSSNTSSSNTGSGQNIAGVRNHFPH